MRKFFSMLVAVIMCVCLVAPVASAAKTADDLLSVFEGVDISSLTDTELAALLGDFNLEGVDLDALKESLSSGSTDALSGLTEGVSGLSGGSGDAAEVVSSLTSGSSDSGLSNLSGLLGGTDMSWLSNVVSDPSAIINMFTQSDTATSGGSFDLSAIKDMISGAFSGNGLDLSSLLSGASLGSFDIGSLLGNSGGAAAGTSNMMAGLADSLKAGLVKLGLDPAMIDGLMDNEVVNFFANLFMGVGGLVNPSGNGSCGISGISGSSSSSTVTTPSAPSAPHTGDNMAVFAALGTISVAAAAAFVCLMKKK